MVEDIILSEIKKKIIKDTYLTLYGILDEHVEKNDKANVGALKHLNGIFVKELIIPVRKKTPYDYIRNFFFFEIMEIHENFLEHHISSKELPSYIFKTKKGKRGSFNFNCIEKCFDGYQKDGETNVKVFQKNRVDKMESSFEETFDYVFLNMTYILDKISENLLKYMRLYWTAVHKKEEEENEEKRIEAYRNFYVCLTAYEIFLRKFAKDKENEYGLYTGFWETMIEDLELLESGTATDDEIIEIHENYCNFDGEIFSDVEELNKHIALYTAALQCVGMIEMVNMCEYGFGDFAPIVVNENDFLPGIFFDKNGNITPTFQNSLQGLAEKISTSYFFTDLPLHVEHDTVKNIYRFMDYIMEDRKASLHVKSEEDGISRLHKLAFDVSFPLLERCGHAIVYTINA